MLVNNHPSIVNDNHHHHHHHETRKTLQKYNSIQPDFQPYANYDLRLIIARHAERIDHSLGKNWYENIFGLNPSPSSQAYRNPALPRLLPRRKENFLYMFDPPITHSAEKQAIIKGQHLYSLGLTVDHCYSSPASRSVITANALLQGMNCAHIKMCLEPYLFEPMKWNSAFSLIDKNHQYPFMSTYDWKQAGYNVDSNYRCIRNVLKENENEKEYYNRSKFFFDFIDKYHGNRWYEYYHGIAPKQRKTVLLVGHSASTEIFSIIAFKQPFNVQTFIHQSDSVPNLHTIILDRDATSHLWDFSPSIYYNQNFRR